MTDHRPPIDGGFLHVVVHCPRCHERVDMAVWIGAKLIVTDDDSALRAVCKSNGVDHKCGQIRLENVVDADPDQRPLDFAELAAGEGTRTDAD
jgi:hypothetical protein